MTLSGPLKDEVTTQLPWLFQQFGFRVIAENYDADSFGNSFVTLESSLIRIRFVRNRGELSVDVASLTEPDAWWQLESVCELISGNPVQGQFELRGAAVLLKSYLPDVLVRFTQNYAETRRGLSVMAERRRRDLMKRLTP